MAASPLRVAIVGGGLSGSLCAALLQRQGLAVQLFDAGKRLGGRTSCGRVKLGEANIRMDVGAQFMVATDPRFQRLLDSPIMAGLVQEWQGRFGVLGARGGEVLCRNVVLESGMMRIPSRPSNAGAGEETDGRSDAVEQEADEAAERERSQSPINYYRFLEGSSGQQLYTGVGGMGTLVPALLDRFSVKTHRASVQELSFELPHVGRRGCWTLQTSCGMTQAFDAVVLANHDPSNAADVIEKLQASAPDPELSQPAVSEVISNFVGRLRDLPRTGRSHYSLTLVFPRPLLELPFEAASVHGAEFNFLSRDTSKQEGIAAPGGSAPECWVLQASNDFAATLDRDIAAMDGPQRLAEATSRLSEAADRLLGRFFGAGTLPATEHRRARRFGRGSFGELLRLNPPNSTHNDAVTFEPWRLAVCGDYLGERQGLQEAALSGTMAANRVAQWAFQHS